MTTIITYRIDDCGGYFQVYEVRHPTEFYTRGHRKGQPKNGGAMKLGNIYPPGFKLFDEEFDPAFYTADHDVYGQVKWQNLSRAIAYLISPRGMA